jgi:hypothetical protein
VKLSIVARLVTDSFELCAWIHKQRPWNFTHIELQCQALLGTGQASQRFATACE